MIHKLKDLWKFIISLLTIGLAKKEYDRKKLSIYLGCYDNGLVLEYCFNELGDSI
jgi:hypothetical protein